MKLSKTVVRDFSVLVYGLGIDESDLLGLTCYRAAILPSLSPIPVASIRRVTGLSRSYCKLIPQGKAIPHSLYPQRSGSAAVLAGAPRFWPH